MSAMARFWVATDDCVSGGWGVAWRTGFLGRCLRFVCGGVNPVCGVTNPVCGEVNPVCGVTNPVCGEVNSVRGVTNSVYGEVNPVRGVTNPVCGEVSPVRGVTNPVCGEVNTVCDVTHPVCGGFNLVFGGLGGVRRALYEVVSGVNEWRGGGAFFEYPLESVKH